VVKPKFDCKTKFKPLYNKRKPTIVKKIYNVFETYDKGSKTLHERLQRKYMIDSDTANAWIIEFRKYIAILLTETDNDVVDVAFPSSIVDCVFQTYAELGLRYQDFCKNLFNGSQYTEAKNFYCDDVENYRNRYEKTLEKYKEFFGPYPEDLWESVENRFAVLQNNDASGVGLGDDNKNVPFSDPNTKVCVNLHRIVAAKALKKEYSDAFKQQKIDREYASNEQDVKDTSNVQGKMNQSKQNSSLFTWRNCFPH
jgi:hypothetical protein